MAGPSTGSSTKTMNGISDDGDNRSRNAKAQRRHREKRKAHLKSLEESVAVLQAQLEETRRGTGGSQSGYPGARLNNGAPLSPQSKDYSQLQAENVYLREENADLRRQLYAYRVNFGHINIPGPSEADKTWTDTKPEGNFGAGVNYGQSGMSSPRGDGNHTGGSRTSMGSSVNNTNNGGRNDYMGVNNHHHYAQPPQPPPHHHNHSYGMPPPQNQHPTWT